MNTLCRAVLCVALVMLLTSPAEAYRPRGQGGAGTPGCSAFQFVATAAEKPGETVAVPADRNPVNLVEKNVLTEFSAGQGAAGGEKNLLWKAKLGKTSYGGPVFAGDRILVGTNNDSPRDRAIEGDKGVLMCFDKKTGRFLWQNVHDKITVGGKQVPEMDYPKQGIVSNPAVEGDRAWYVSNRCEVVCVDLNGDATKPGRSRTHWSYDMIAELKVYPCQLAVCSPVVVGDLVFVCTGNGWDVGPTPWKFPSPEAPSFIALNKTTGKLIWKDSSPGKNIMEGQWSNPVYAPNNGKPLVIFPGGDGWLYAFDAVKPGKAVWKFNCNPTTAVYNHQNKRTSDKIYFIGTPVVHDNRLYVGMGVNPEDGPGAGHVWCVDVTKTGDVSSVNDNFDPKAPVNKNSALVWHYGGKIVPRPQQDREYYIGRTLSTPTVFDGLLYLPEQEGYFHCFDAKTGEKYWTHDMRAECWSSGYYVAGKVYLGNDDGDILVFDHGKQLKKPQTITIGPALKKPIQVKDGVVYVLTDSYLYAFGKK